VPGRRASSAGPEPAQAQERPSSSFAGADGAEGGGDLRRRFGGELGDLDGEVLGRLDEAGVIEQHQGLQGRVGIEPFRLADLPRAGVEDQHVVRRGGAFTVGVEAATVGGFLDAFTADLLDQLAGRQQSLVADHLGGQAKDRPAGEVFVGRIFFAGGGRRRRGLPERAAQDEATEHRLRIPAATDEIDRQGIEEFGMGRQVALQAEVLAGRDKSRAEDLGPETIDDHARGQRVPGVREPAGEAKTVLGQGFIPREDARRHAGLAGLGQVGLVVFAAGQDVGLGSERRMFHRIERRSGLLMGGKGSLGFL
jgi:hypothetical protein